MAAPAPTRGAEALRENLRAARAQGDHAATARFAARLADALIADGALDEAAQILAEVLADNPTAAELRLRQATIERRQGHDVAAAATLGALLGQQGLAPISRVRAQLAMAGLLQDGGDLERAEATYREALASARALADLESEARALIGAYGIAARTGRAAEAAGPLAEARSIAERLGDPGLQSAAAAAEALAALGGHDARKGEERIAEAKDLHLAERREEHGSVEQGPVDVLILTALQDELAAVLALGEGGRPAWQELRDLGGFRYYRRSLPSARGARLAVAAAWIGEMGERTASIRGQQLLTELSPSCLAMCGICAGDREKVALGDVIVADRLYDYDAGKSIKEPGHEAELFHDLRSFDLQAAWKMDAAYLARELDLAALSRERPPSKEAQRRWLLRTLYAHEAEGGPPPAAHADRARACPGWTEQLKRALKEGLVTASAGRMALTERGRESVLEERLLYPDGPAADPPLRVHVGAIATVKAVQQDPAIFERLRRLVRGTLGLEMEGAAIGDLAARFDKRSILMKAVSDHADFDKDDSFRAFACHAAATVLLAFLQKHLEPERRPSEPARRHEARGRDKRRVEGGERLFEDRRDGFLARVERVALLRDPGATITRNSAPAPFAGLLEIAVKDGAIFDVRVIGAIDQPVTEALVTQYVAEVERPYRQENPSVSSTLIHGGAQAPIQLALSARRQGVALKTFAEYQGLIDFTRYLAWQTSRLEVDPVYPPSLYVEQPAKVSLAGMREEQSTESALKTLWDLLDAPHPRFALVLGDFGAGKTFLLHELARRMATQKHPLVPVLVEMSTLEKQRSLRALVAQHFAMADMGRMDVDAFQYMLAEGRIALLFDGYDELALRVTYDRAMEHFETIVQAAQGNAKVVLTSRTQHFLTDHQIKRALAERAEQVPGYRLFQVEKFGETQIRRFLGNLILDPMEAEERYRLLDEVKDLLGLSANPRMLGFIAKIEPAKLREAKEKSGEITAAKLYEVLIEQWLDFEYLRANPPGAPKGIPRDKLRELMTRVAQVFWGQAERALGIQVLCSGMTVDGLDPAIVEQMVGSGSLLVRDAEGRFSFVHRSVMEWLVAEAAAREVRQTGDAAALGGDEMSELMADFFVSLASQHVAWTWAKRTLSTGPRGHRKANALRILRRIDGVEPVELDLAGQDLSGQDLSGRDLRWANLEGTNLRGANLVKADLRGANLAGAQLQRADLGEADLGRARMAGADLSFARLLGASLRGAEGLAQVRVRGAKLVGATGVEIEGLAAAGAAPPVPGEVEAMWTVASECNAVAWSPSGDLVASGHDDGSVRLWDAVSGQAIRTMVGHSERVWSVAFSPDGLSFASASADGTLRLWDVASGRSLRAFEGHTNIVRSVAFSPDGISLASGSIDTTLRLWDVATGRCLRAFKGHTDTVRSVAFSPDGISLASGSDDKTLRLWDVATGRSLRAFDGHTRSVWSVAFSPDGLSLASASSDATLRLWDVASGRSLRAFEGHTSTVWSVAFSPDGLSLASASSDDTLRLWDVASGRSLRAFEGDMGTVRSVAFSPDGLSLASASSDDDTLRFWDIASGRSLRVFKGYTNRATSIAFSPDGLSLASGSDDKTLRLWDVATGRSHRAFEGHMSTVWSVAFSPDGLSLASASSDTTIRLWDVASGCCLRAFEGHTMAVWSVAFSPDGLSLASGSNDTTLRLWDVATGRSLRAFEGHMSTVWSVAFSPDGLFLASASDDTTLRLWDVATGRSLRAFEGHTNTVMSVAFSPDGLFLASASDDKTLRLWDVATGRSLRAFEGHTNRVMSVAFSHDGLSLASASLDGTLRLWAVASGRSLRTFEGHNKTVMSVSFSPDGLTLASASDDGTLRLWDVATARCLAILLPTPEGWAAFTPDGRYKIGGDIAGSFWHVIGLCRFEPGELDLYLPRSLRIPDDVPFRDLPPG